MTEQDRTIEAALQRLLAAYERLGTVRRRALGLNANEESALLLLGQGMTAPSDLSRAIGMTTAGITNMLDRLEAEGLLRREPHHSDKRRVLLTLTKRGFRAQLELEAVHEHVAASVGPDDDAARDLVTRFLEAAVTAVEQRTDDLANAHGAT